MNGLHVEGMTEDERDVFIGAQVGEPVPGKHAFDRDDDIRPIRRNGFEKGLWGSPSCDGEAAFHRPG
jgi:hypothetical protein